MRIISKFYKHENDITGDRGTCFMVELTESELYQILIGSKYASKENEEAVNALEKKLEKGGGFQIPLGRRLESIDEALRHSERSFRDTQAALKRCLGYIEKVNEANDAFLATVKPNPTTQ